MTTIQEAKRAERRAQREAIAKHEGMDPDKLGFALTWTDESTIEYGNKTFEMLHATIISTIIGGKNRCLIATPRSDAQGVVDAEDMQKAQVLPEHITAIKNIRNDKSICLTCAHSSQKDFENRSYMASNMGCYCNKAKMRVKSTGALDCWEPMR